MLFAILLPPLYLLVKGHPFKAIIGLILCCTIIGWVVAAIWAVGVRNDEKAKKRHEEMLREIQLARAQAGGPINL